MWIAMLVLLALIMYDDVDSVEVDDRGGDLCERLVVNDDRGDC